MLDVAIVGAGLAELTATPDLREIRTAVPFRGDRSAGPRQEGGL